MTMLYRSSLGRSLQEVATRKVAGLFPTTGPWTSAALWHGVHQVPVPTTPLAPELDIICEHRLTPLLLSYVKQTGAQVSDAERETLQAHAFHWTSWSHQVMRNSVPLLDSLRSSGIPFVISKGP